MRCTTIRSRVSPAAWRTRRMRTGGAAARSKGRASSSARMLRGAPSATVSRARAAGVQQRGEPVDGAGLEQRVDRDLHLQLLVQPEDELDGAEGVAAECEEVLVYADRRPLEHLRQDLGDPPLGRADRLPVRGRA